jgi:hypothetical protein
LEATKAANLEAEKSVNVGTDRGKSVAADEGGEDYEVNQKRLPISYSLL